MVLRKPRNTPVRKKVSTSKKWQKLFRYTVEREKAIKELVVFVHLVDDLAKRSTHSPDSILDINGRTIYL